MLEKIKMMILEWIKELFTKKDSLKINQASNGNVVNQNNVVKKGAGSVDIDQSKTEIVQTFNFVNEKSKSLKEELDEALNDEGNWFRSDGPNGFYFLNENFPDVRFVVEEGGGEFHGSWVPKGPSSAKSWRYLAKLYFRGQVFPYTVVAVNVDERSFRAAPDCWYGYGDESKGDKVSSFFYVAGSMELLLDRIFRANHPQHNRRFEFPVFESKEIADAIFQNDVKRKRKERKYVYYSAK